MKLLSIEFAKLLPYRSFKILFGVYLFLQVGFLFTGKSIVQVDDTDLSSVFNVFQFPNIWNYYLYFAGIFNIILGILVIFITCNEYTYKTIRQNIIDGLSRNEFVSAKILMIITLAIISTVIVYAGGLLAGNVYTGDSSRMFERNSLIGGYFVQCLGILSMAFFFGILFKRSGIAVLLFLIFLFPLDVIINKAILRDCCNDYLPVSNYFIKIIQTPYVMIRSAGEEVQTAPSLLSISVGLFYILLFLGLSWFTVKRRDL
ncbi:MAG: ABC transporter permease [Chitinophagales bacterium]|nr:ABC transporter permease [Chitinophagales bacterium]